MNIFRKFYCRAFQLVFKIAIPLLPYKQPKILQSVSDAARAMKGLRVKRAFIVTDAGVMSHGLCDGLTAALDELKIEYAIYDKTVPNPTVATVEDARAKYTDEGCDAIIAVGGGSPIDLAKAVGARIAKPKKSLNAMAGILRVGKKLPPLFAVPTTAGTGDRKSVV